MAKKPFNYQERSSSQHCEKCGIGIKKNVIKRKSTQVKLCYPCFITNKRKVIGDNNV